MRRSDGFRSGSWAWRIWRRRTPVIFRSTSSNARQVSSFLLYPSWFGSVKLKVQEKLSLHLVFNKWKLQYVVIVNQTILMQFNDFEIMRFYRVLFWSLMFFLCSQMMKIYEKLCELKGCNTLTGRVIEQKIAYSGTRYPEINKKVLLLLVKSL